MKWNVIYSIRSIIAKGDTVLENVDYKCTANSEQEAINNAKKYIINLLRCDNLIHDEIGEKLIVYDNNKEKVIKEYLNFNVKRIYTLIGKDGNPYDSYTPGLLGGHKKLKIYGRLDCPSALRHIAKGQYVANRVFFADEETAIAAGYRPCGVCMKEEYKKWKTEQERKKDKFLLKEI